MDKNRCGAFGSFQALPEGIMFFVKRIIDEINYNGRCVTLSCDLKIGDRITLQKIAREHRGVVILNSMGEYQDEGEITETDHRGPVRFVFVSDHDDGPFANATIEALVNMPIKLKPEIYDEIGAARRLQEFKSKF